jgi:hypothetical protein
MEKPGDVIPADSELWYEYHCNESHDSPDAPLWYRSHQRATVIEMADGQEFLDMTQAERAESGHPLTYRVRFKDGFEGVAYEDELIADPKDFCRPDPPAPRAPDCPGQAPDIDL